MEQINGGNGKAISPVPARSDRRRDDKPLRPFTPGGEPMLNWRFPVTGGCHPVPMLRLCPSRSLRYRWTLAFAYLAMTLLFVGPLISQFQAGDHGHGQHHARQHHHASDHHADQQIHAHHDHAAAHHEMAEHRHADGAEDLSHWHVLCGYCELWQHTPTLFLSLPVIAREAVAARSGRFIAPAIKAPRLLNYPHALTRGPPALTRPMLSKNLDNALEFKALFEKTKRVF
ncbi:DUF2946 domain-containing protein [Halomonas sp. HNIBRBA4712]|uniref:DUF2946 domain-containing protein n=1 Tax=Halomonas sp. HNIBRBA4712 TaxID=3373087 RepID=UPI00374660C6